MKRGKIAGCGYPMATILLVEDNEMSADMLSRRLERRGYQVLVASDGQKAVDMTLESHPDVVLMDMSLPVIDGWEATRRIKANETARKIDEVVREILKVSDVQTAGIKASNSFDAFHIAAKQGHLGKLLSAFPCRQRKKNHCIHNPFS